jgi:hypothetical protein
VRCNASQKNLSILIYLMLMINALVQNSAISLEKHVNDFRCSSWLGLIYPFHILIMLEGMNEMSRMIQNGLFATDNMKFAYF